MKKLFTTKNSIVVTKRSWKYSTQQACNNTDVNRLPEVAAAACELDARHPNNYHIFLNNAKMSYWSYLWRLVRRYILCPESFICLILLIVLYNAFVNVSPLWRMAKQKFGIPSMSPRHVYNVYQSARDDKRDEDLYWPSDPNKLSWELKSGNAAAYSIQGRRPHMEDRFRVHNNGSKVALYGIFDGHGGEVGVPIL